VQYNEMNYFLAFHRLSLLIISDIGALLAVC